MSRVDEALRRATGQIANEAEKLTGVGVVSDLESADVAVLSRTAFPIEMPERRRPKPPSAAPLELEEAMPVLDPAKPVSLLDRIDARLAQKVVVDERVMPASREQYRRLAAALHHAQSANGTKVVMIASAVPGEGKTLTAANLALTFSESYQRNVLLIDGDIRKPGLHIVFGIGNNSGLSEGLTSEDERKLGVQQITPRLAVLTAGTPTDDPMAGLTSDRMRRVLDEAREGFDWVFIDTPPVGFLSDANLLARMVDAAVLVVKAGETSYDLVQRAVESIGRDRAIGVVLNRADSADAGGYGSGYSYGYGYGHSRRGNQHSDLHERP